MSCIDSYMLTLVVSERVEINSLAAETKFEETKKKYFFYMQIVENMPPRTVYTSVVKFSRSL